MNPILQNKLNELKNARDYECWYLVKQPTSFDNICYLVSFLNEFKSNETTESLQKFIEKKVEEINLNKPNIEISNNYRALRVAAFFGLIKMVSSKYEEAIITDTFKEINSRCSGNFENKNLYIDIIQRQIEKMYISSSIDEANSGIRQNYRLYPVMLLYKILIELGLSTGKYSISMVEYRYLIATTKVFEDFLETLLLIKLLRENPSATTEFEKYRTKFDNRLVQALKQLPTLIIDRDSITLNPNLIAKVKKEVFIFESNPNIFTNENYLKFLGSKRSLFELEITENTITNDELPCSNQLDLDKIARCGNGSNVLLYGVPGSGKSWIIEHEYCKKGTKIERLVFYPDYTYSDFIGQILPHVAEDGQVSYIFTPGPFTKILADAYNQPDEEYILIIEEINRGNAPSIFGEVFQLLDRKNEIKETDDDGYPIGTSEYSITNSNIAKIVYGDKNHKVRIPANLSIIGTMNTSDQNVFTLDTAFQRRWDMHLVENDFKHVNKKLANAAILDTGVSWKTFCEQINKIIVDNNIQITSAEDKRLGVHFVHLTDLQYNTNMGDLSADEYRILCKKEQNNTINDIEKTRLNEIRNAMKQNRKFPEKVIKYLWDDAFKFNRESVFEPQYRSLEQVIHAFMYTNGTNRFNIFKDHIRDSFRNTEQ